MSDCIFDDSLRCKVCRKAIDIPGVKRNCNGFARVFLGDFVEKLFKFVGITPSRVQVVTGKACGCNKRREQLNSLFGVSRAKNAT